MKAVLKTLNSSESRGAVPQAAPARVAVESPDTALLVVPLLQRRWQRVEHQHLHQMEWAAFKKTFIKVGAPDEAGLACIVGQEAPSAERLP